MMPIVKDGQHLWRTMEVTPMRLSDMIEEFIKELWVKDEA
ncbi:MAG: CtsR family transcriptional regulator, partial [Clostridiales bacterium]|nr:CtsR family transcriptional regulator [Clostridiales bacterium]